MPRTVWISAGLAGSYSSFSRNQRMCTSIVRFDPEAGCIDAVADLSLLWEIMTPDERASTNSSENVLNGIAYDAQTGLFYLTGKRWKAIFVGRFRDRK